MPAFLIEPNQESSPMAFVNSSSFIYPFSKPQFQGTQCSRGGQGHLAKGRAIVRMSGAPIGGSGKKPSRNRRFRPGKAGPEEKKKLEPETVFKETPPSRLELIVPTLSILTVIGIIPFIGAVARALWVRYKITSRRISISSGFQGKDQIEIIYRDIDNVKFVRRLGNAADCVITLRDGSKLEIRSMPEFDEVYQYIMDRVDENVREASGPA